MFPILKEKKFINLTDNSVVSVVEQFENIAILDNGQRIDIKRLMDKGHYDDYIDPKSFFGDTFNVFADKIKSVDLSQIQDEDPINDSAIIEVDPEQERRDMEEKALRMAQQMNPNVAAQKQIDMLKEILGDDDGATQIDESQTIVNVNNNQQAQVSKSYTPPTINQSKPIVSEVVNDPITNMFRNVKRNQDFNFTFTIDGKIPRLDFIEMMEDSYETSIIDFLATEFTNSLITNPESIKSKITTEIKRLVYKKVSDGNTRPTKRVVKKPTTTKSKSISDKQKKSPIKKQETAE